MPVRGDEGLPRGERFATKPPIVTCENACGGETLQRAAKNFVNRVRRPTKLLASCREDAVLDELRRESGDPFNSPRMRAQLRALERRG
jgi:hypothetical protein